MLQDAEIQKVQGCCDHCHIKGTGRPVVWTAELLESSQALTTILKGKVSCLLCFCFIQRTAKGAETSLLWQKKRDNTAITNR